MTTVSVIYYSATGTVRGLAEEAAASAREAGAEVRLRAVPGTPEAGREPGTPDATPEDLEWADGILLGSPSHWGLPAAPLLEFVNTTPHLSHAGAFVHKAASAFVAGSSRNGGLDNTIQSLHSVICHWGAAVIPMGSAHPVLYLPQNGNPYGTHTASGADPGTVHEDAVAAVRFQAARTAWFARALARARQEA
ncbi:NAD(P)H-dependent oxidoreductase [Streptomyces sp. NBC_01244]|uniref:NAD(P)H-dependent oxidoreductase n=1 Tax=Streptomyces sp. NBC_01244 TaxID=2903797 RepID=UPI002E0E4DAA|nr:NAD(P)H-dependent oxidoreductase [Streptomyces sp. NBC_01244]